jgi:glycosyltransferase involved in cell wall biosynthesis
MEYQMRAKKSDQGVHHFPGHSLLSVIVPIYNEQEVIVTFHKRLQHALAATGVPKTEIIYVNDGSTDRSMALLLQCMRHGPSFHIIDFTRNFGKEAAMTAGIEYARGDAAIIIDADLQDPPELIPEMVLHWRQGYDVVNMRRKSREGDSLLKRKTAQAFYTLMGHIGPVKMPCNVGDFRLLSKNAMTALRQMPERNRFMKGMFTWIGFSVKELGYHRDARYAGSTKWNYFGLWKLALEGITSYTTAPLKAATYVGLVIALSAFFYGLVIFLKTLFLGNPVPGYPSLMVVILFLGGIQLLAIGIVGEYLGRIFTETKGRPLYLVKGHYKASASRKAMPEIISQRNLA